MILCLCLHFPIRRLNTLMKNHPFWLSCWFYSFNKCVLNISYIQIVRWYWGPKWEGRQGPAFVEPTFQQRWERQACKLKVSQELRPETA